MAYIRNLRMFVRIYELGSMSAAARDLRTSPAVASSRISDLEKHLGVRLFNRTTRALQPTGNGKLFYKGACKVLDTIAEAEAAISSSGDQLKGTIFVAAPLGVGRRFIAPVVPEFKISTLKLILDCECRIGLLMSQLKVLIWRFTLEYWKIAT